MTSFDDVPTPPLTQAGSWFRLDENSVPPQWCLNALNQDNRKDFWERVSPILTLAFRKASDQLYEEKKITAAERGPFHVSVTEQEVRLGVLDSSVDHQPLVHLREIEVGTGDALASTYFNLAKDGSAVS